MKRFLNKRQVRFRYGDTSEPTLWRWQKSHGFPKPLYTPGGYAIWLEEELDRWDELELRKVTSKTPPKAVANG